CLRGVDHSVNVSASGIINEWEISVPPRVAGVQHIGFREIEGNVAVRVSRSIAFERNGGAIEMKRLVGGEHVSWNRACRRWRKSEIPIVDSGCRGKMLFRVLVRHDRRTGRVHPFVAVGVIEMPVGVYQMFDRIAADTRQRISDLLLRS